MRILLIYALIVERFTLSNADPAVLLPADEFGNSDAVRVNENDGRTRVLVRGAGSSFPSQLYQLATFAYQFSPEGADATVEYTGMGSFKGKCRIMDYASKCESVYASGRGFEVGDVYLTREFDLAEPMQVDYAASDSLLTDEEYDEYPDLQMFPSVAGAVVPIFNLPELGDEMLVLTPLVLARIFRQCDETSPGCPPGAVTTWGHPDIIAANNDSVASVLNSTLKDVPIQVVVRADKSGTTEIMKKSLNSFGDENFGAAAGIPISSSADWGPASTSIRMFSNVGVAGFVSRTPYSIGYAVLGDANSVGLQTCGLRRAVGDPNVITASVESVTAAVMENGLGFANDVMRERLTVDIFNAGSIRAWPIAGFTYFVLRTRTTRRGASCANRKATLKFFEWFYEDEVPRSLARDLGFASLPENVRKTVLETLRKKFVCVDPSTNIAQKLFIDPEDIWPKLHTFGTPMLYSVFATYGQIFSALETDVLVDRFVPSLAPERLIRTEGPLSTSGVAVTILPPDSALYNDPEFVELPLVAVGMGVIFNLCSYRDLSVCSNPRVVFSLRVLANVLSGAITRWDHPSILALNPTLQSRLIDFGVTNITVVGLDTVSRTTSDAIVAERAFLQSFESKIRALGSDFADFNVNPQVRRSSEQLVAAAVSTIAGSVAFKSFSSPLSTLASKVHLLLAPDGRGSAVAHTAENMLSCVQVSTVAATGTHPKFIRAEPPLLSSTGLAPNCYPLFDVVSVIAVRSFKGAGKQPATETVFDDDPVCRNGRLATMFLGWLFSNAIQLEGGGLAKVTLLDDQGNGKQKHQAYVPVDLPLLEMEMAPLAQIGDVRTTTTLLHSIEDCNGVPILAPPNKSNHIPRAIVAFAYVFTSVSIIIFIALSWWVHKLRRVKLMKLSSPRFLQIILLGATMMMSCIVPLCMQDDGWEQAQLDAACRYVPFAFSVGYVLMFGALWLKTWRLNKIFNNKTMRKVKISDKNLMYVQAGILFAMVAWNVVWLLLDPLTWRRFPVNPSAKDPEASTFGTCHSDNFALFGGMIVSTIIALLLYGTWLTFKGRNIPSEYSEGKYLAMAMITNTEAMILGVPTFVLVSGNNPTATFFILFFLVSVISLATVLIVFLPKVLIANGYLMEKTNAMNDGSSSQKMRLRRRMENAMRRISANRNTELLSKSRASQQPSQTSSHTANSESGRQVMAHRQSLNVPILRSQTAPTGDKRGSIGAQNSFSGAKVAPSPSPSDA